MAEVVAAPSMAGVQSNTDDMKGQALDAMARGGKAGLDAFNAAQQNVQGYRQQVLGSILGTTGLADDAKSALQAKVESSLAPHLADLSTGQANLQGDLARGNQQYANYAGMASAAVPVIQANQQTQAGIRDQALQLAQQQIDADKAAKAADYQHQIQLAQLQLQQQQAQTDAARANAAKAAAGASAVKPVTATQAGNVTKGTESIASLYGGSTNQQTKGRTPITDDMMMSADDEAGAAMGGDSRYSSDPNVNLAKIVAQTYGLTPEQASQVITPSFGATVAQSKALNPPPPPDVKAAASALGGNVNDANAVLRGSQWNNVVSQVNHFATAPLDPATGTINAPGDPSNGLTPWEAYSNWVTQSGNLAPGDTKTLQVLTKTYKPFLDGIAGK